MEIEGFRTLKSIVQLSLWYKPVYSLLDFPENELFIKQESYGLPRWVDAGDEFMLLGVDEDEIVWFMSNTSRLCFCAKDRYEELFGEALCDTNVAL